MGGANWPEAGRAAMQGFAEASDIPVVAVFRYQDQFDNHSPCFAGEAGVGMPPHVKALIREADVILAVNARFGEMTAFFEGVGTGDTSGIWEGAPNLRPDFRAIHQKKLDKAAKAAKAEEMI